jgi:hypothetical protein
VEDFDAVRTPWVLDLPQGQPDKVGLARLVDADGGRDEAENEYYEAAADPDYVRLETARRRFRGQYLRHVRRLHDRARHSST